MKSKKKNPIRKLIIIMAVIVLAAAIVIALLWYERCVRAYDGYEVKSETQLSGAESSLSYEKFADGYLQCGASSLIYFTESEIIWDASFEMSRPILDVCGEYAAVADTGSSDAYVFDKSGQISRISLTNDITDVEISENGLVALSADDGESNYIYLRDSEGGEIINIKSVFSSSGYLTDIALSNDGTRLAAAFLCVSEGVLASRVLFYDFSTGSTDEMLVAEFDGYEDTVITDVEFMGNGKVCAVGDNRIIFFGFAKEVSVIGEEAGEDLEIQSLSITKNRLLLVVRDDESEYNYRALVYNASGRKIADVGFDFAYQNARLAGSNILLYSATDCQLINFNGRVRYSGSVGERIVEMMPLGPSVYILATASGVRFIKLG